MCVSRTYSFGLEWWLHLLVLQFFPVDIAEEGMFLDVSLALGAAAQTLTWVFGHELKHTETRRVDASLTGSLHGGGFFFEKKKERK